MRQQMSQLPRMGTNDDGDSIARDGDRIGDHDVLSRPARQLHQLLGLAQATGGAGSENQDVRRGGHVSDSWMTDEFG